MACELQKERKRECARECVCEKDKRERYPFSRELTHPTGKKLIVPQNTPKQ